MRVLFVTPSEVSTGEAITAGYMATDVMADGGKVHFLASAFTATFLADGFSGHLTTLSEDLATNRRHWQDSIRQFAPDVVAFADYPLLFFPSGTAPLVDDSWLSALHETDAALVTLDHLGYAQRPMTIDFGPPHLSMASATTPTPPDWMRIALPCPVNDPGEVVGRAGRPFRFWRPPTVSAEEIAAVRRRYVDDERDLLVLHFVPGWARRAAEVWELPYFRLLPRLLSSYLGGLPGRVTVVSVNDGQLLPPSDRPDVRIVNLAGVPAAEFDRLLLASDLVLTENSVSTSLGKAVCAGRPSAVLRNSYRLVELIATANTATRDILMEFERARLGAVFPYEVFPIWGRSDLDRLGIHRDNPFAAGFEWLEAFGGDETRDAILRLLLDDGVRDELRARQEAYSEAVDGLPGPAHVLRDLAS